jgi:hypothetical protein
MIEKTKERIDKTALNRDKEHKIVNERIKNAKTELK